MRHKVLWQCPNHGSYKGDPDENPHTEIEAEWGGTDEMSSEAQVFKAINEMAATRKCSCGEALAQQGG